LPIGAGKLVSGQVTAFIVVVVFFGCAFELEEQAPNSRALLARIEVAATRRPFFMWVLLR
jgi:hypothetical protein